MTKVVRCNVGSPTPYLRTWFPKLKLEKDAVILDLGCGNGRNSKFIIEHGFHHIFSYDLCGDYGVGLNLATQQIPHIDRIAELILCNYVLCFLGKKERIFLASEIERVADIGCYLIVELYSGKQTLPFSTNEIAKLFKHWEFQHLIKNRFVARKVK